ncbi:MAG: hypothetical protein JXM70_23155 [Pirellulales bacterium]|nr:hypothetical protein [Pirellulales bacterium]
MKQKHRLNRRQILTSSVKALGIALPLFIYSGCKKHNSGDKKMNSSCKENSQVFYGLWPVDQERCLDQSDRAKWIISPPGCNDWIRASKVDEEIHEIHECPLDSSHVTHEYYSRIELTYFGNEYYGNSVLPIIPAEEVFLVNKELASALSKSGLTGVKVKKAEIGCCGNLTNTPEKEITPEIYFLQFTAPDFYRHPELVDGVPNSCPFCGDAPLVCPGCGHVRVKCPKCGERCFKNRRPKRSSNNNFVI